MEKKQVKMFSRMADFEAFVNSEGIEIITIDIKVVEQSSWFQESFAAIVYFKTPSQPSEQKPSEGAEGFLRKAAAGYEPFTPFGLNKLPYVLYDAVSKVMQEYAQQSMKQERERAIQECKNVFTPAFEIKPHYENLVVIMETFKKCFQELEKLKK